MGGGGCYLPIPLGRLRHYVIINQSRGLVKHVNVFICKNRAKCKSMWGHHYLGHKIKEKLLHSYILYYTRISI